MYKILIKLIKINKYIYQYCIGFIILKTDLKSSIEKLIIFFSSLVNLCIDFFLLLLFIKKKTINLKKNKIFDECYKKFFHEKSKILILDIGAHRGESILRFKELFKNSRIISFEPNPNAIESIKEKIKLYDLDKIFYHQKAIGPKNKVVNFFIYKKEDVSSVLELDKNSRFYKIRANEYSNNKNFEKKKLR